MANPDLLRIVDAISRDKSLDKELVFADLESAMVSAVRKAFGQFEDVTVTIDRVSGTISAMAGDERIEMSRLGRIPAQTAKQVMIQKIREAERSSIYEEYVEREGEIVTGTVARFEGGNLVVNFGRAEGFLPRSEQIPGELHHPGERVRAMILEVREAPHQVKIVLTRTHPDFIRRLFELEVPEVAERVIEIRALAREAGYRTKVAVSSIDAKVDAVGACVGVRGSRIKNIVEELGGEKIDIVRWNESSQILIGNALKPAEVQDIALCFELGRATVVVAEDQLSLAIGKRGQNVRLAARLTGWDVDILTPAEYNKGLDNLEASLKNVEGVEDVLLDKLLAMGMVSLADVEEVGVEPLVQELGVGEELAARIQEVASREAKRIAAEMQEAKAKEAAEAEAAAKAEAAGEAVAEGAETSASEGQQPDPDETAESPAEESEQTGEQVLAAQVADGKDAVVTTSESEPDAESSVPEGSTEDGGDDAVESGDES